LIFKQGKNSERRIEDYALVVDGKLDFPEVIWQEMLDRFGREKLHVHVSGLIDGLEFPYREYSEVQLRRDWQRLLTETENFEEEKWEAKRVPSVSDFTYLGEYRIIKGSNYGLKVSDHFTQAQRMRCGFSGGGSPYSQWNRKGERRTFLRPLFTLEGIIRGQVNNRVLYDGLRLDSYMASQFKPSVVKSVYRAFNARSVLDLSMGWGDRLVGFLASEATSYVGIDPNTALHPLYEGIRDYCARDKQTEFLCACAEDVDLGVRRFDFVFTSPPYFDRERYSDEDTQSWKRYPSEDSWLNGFLFRALQNAWDHLDEGGRIAINISDVKIGKDEFKIVCQPMLNFMQSLGAVYEGVIGYKLKKRPNDPFIKEDVELGEPIFIWSKGKASPPVWSEEFFSF